VKSLASLVSVEVVSFPNRAWRIWWEHLLGTG
jgi:hypothetical protein